MSSQPPAPPPPKKPAAPRVRRDRMGRGMRYHPTDPNHRPDVNQLADIRYIVDPTAPRPPGSRYNKSLDILAKSMRKWQAQNPGQKHLLWESVLSLPRTSGSSSSASSTTAQPANTGAAKPKQAPPPPAKQ